MNIYIYRMILESWKSREVVYSKGMKNNTIYWGEMYTGSKTN